MSKYTQIQKELQAVNEAKFQHICNMYLYTEYKGEVHSPGTVDGKEKTSKGKPDSYIRHDDGTYTLIEATTRDKLDKAGFLAKLEKDVKDCLKFKKLGIKPEQVRLIIAICNSEVDTVEREKLEEIAAPYQLQVLGIHHLTLFLMDKGKTAAKDFLDIPFETGQVLTKEQFLTNYEKRNVSTPLRNPLLGREQETEGLLKLVRENSIVLIRGASGVGKSRLTLHVIDQFVALLPSFTPYYIFQKNNSISEDLVTYLKQGKQYILFIDDANRQLDNFLSILNAQLEKEKDLVKIVMTVRDYAKEEVLSRCRNLKPCVFELQKLPGETIRSIVKDFGVSLPALLNRIEQISKGNPRLAIMAALPVKDDQDITKLKDVSTVYEEYFQTLVHERDVFRNPDVLKSLGLLSYFNALDLETEEALAVLNDFDIPQSQFMDVIYQMRDLELVDIYKGYTVNVVDQVLATFFFYKVFIQERLLSFSLLLNIHFEKSGWRMRDSFYPANIAFGSERVFEKVKGDLRNYYNKVQAEEETLYHFLDVFGRFMPGLLFFMCSRR